MWGWERPGGLTREFWAVFGVGLEIILGVASAGEGVVPGLCAPPIRKRREGMGARVAWRGWAWVLVAPAERVCGMTARDKCEARGVTGTTRTVEGDIQARSRGGRGCRAGVQVIG